MLKQYIEQLRALIATKMTERQTHTDAIQAVRSACMPEGGTQRDPSAAEAETVRAAQEARTRIDAEVEQLRTQLAEYESELEADEAAQRLAREVGSAGNQQRTPGTQVGSEPRTYARELDPTGKVFLNDVLRAHLGDFRAQQKISRHEEEERVERGDALVERAAGTDAYAGTIVPQYLTDLYAQLPNTGRHFANICRHHDLPETGMTVYIPRQTAELNVDDQAAQGDLVADADYADELIPIPVRTAAGSTSIRRQAIDRGVGIEDMTFEDLLRKYDRNLDRGLLNKATVGLSAVSGVNMVAYTDGTPTAEELYPKLLQAQSVQETGLLDVAEVDYIVMHSRRWNWLQSQLVAKWPAIGQPAIDPRLIGQSDGNPYKSGVRGKLPNGLTVVTDNNILTNKGAGTNEDEMYTVASQECHLWEDPRAPFYIRAEQAQAKRLTIDLVLYGYYAFKFDRYAAATAKIAGTGLVAPTF